MYEQHYKRAVELFGELQGYENAPPFDKTVILLRLNKIPYSKIQAHLGNPSKKLIRQTLLTWAPELIELDCNVHKLKKQPIDYALKLVNLLMAQNVWIIDTEEVWYKFWLENNTLIMEDECGNIGPYKDWDENTQKNIYNDCIKYFSE